MLCMCINVLLYVFCPYGHLYKYLWLFNQFNSMASFNEANIFKCSGLFIIEKLKKYKESVNFTKRKAFFFIFMTRTLLSWRQWSFWAGTRECEKEIHALQKDWQLIPQRKRHGLEIKKQFNIILLLWVLRVWKIWDTRFPQKNKVLFFTSLNRLL